MRRLALAIALVAIPAWAAITPVANNVTGGVTNGTSFNLTVTTTAGNLAVVVVMVGNSGTTITVSGNVSGSYTASSVGQINNGAMGVELFYNQNTGADTLITVSATDTPGQLWGEYMEFAGATTSGGEDGTATGTGTGTAVATGTLTSTGTTDVVIGGGGRATGSNTWTAGSGFTLNAGTAQSRVGQEYEIFTSAVNQTVTFTISSSGAWAATASAFKAAGGAAGCATAFTAAAGAGCH